MSIESRNYVLTAKDARYLVAELVAGDKQTRHAGITFLRGLGATAQVKCGLKAPRGRAVAPARFNEEMHALQIAAVREVFNELYGAAKDHMGTIRIDLHAGTAPSVKLEITRRLTFMRSAKSEILGWLRDGNDLLSIAPHKLTKSWLREQRKPKKAVKPEQAVTNLAARLAQAVTELAESDKAAARRALETSMASLGGVMGHIGIRVQKATKGTKVDELASRSRVTEITGGERFYRLPAPPMPAANDGAAAAVQ